jgi:hypothetical protein
MESLKLKMAAGALALTLGAAGAAQAALPLCTNGDISPTASDCGGFFAGNLINNSPAAITAQKADLLASFGFVWDGVTLAEPDLPSLSGMTVNFAGLLYGDTIVGMHFGKGNVAHGGVGAEATAFYEFDAGTTGLDFFTISHYVTLSNARVYSTGKAPINPPPPPPPGVPEPAAWALMLLGFGGIGATLRAARRSAVVKA